jgi:hypothetical protein
VKFFGIKSTEKKDFCETFASSQGRSVPIVAKLQFGKPKILDSVCNREKIFSLLPRHPDQLWGPLSLLYNRFQSLFPRVQHLDHETDHSPPSSAEVKNAQSCTFTPTYVFIA